MMFRNKILSILCSLSFWSTYAFADWSQEKQKIDYLLTAVTELNGVFIRNGNEYPAKKAADHLRMKLGNAQSSWFAPAKEKWTVHMFIEKIATKSSISGEAYKIKFKDGKLIDSSDWLNSKLSGYKPKN